MSQQQYLKALHNELQKLNEKIDRKIMIGRNYSAYAKQHKQILMRIRRHEMPRQERPGIFTRISSIFHYA